MSDLRLRRAADKSPPRAALGLRALRLGRHEEDIMKAYVIFDVEIDDPIRYQEYRDLLWRGVEAAGGKYLVRDGAVKVYEGEWTPRDLVLLE